MVSSEMRFCAGISPCTFLAHPRSGIRADAEDMFRANIHYIIYNSLSLHIYIYTQNIIHYYIIYIIYIR